jgi:hypothetical protein
MYKNADEFEFNETYSIISSAAKDHAFNSHTICETH